jgi:hypothetical protein
VAALVLGVELLIPAALHVPHPHLSTAGS